jgi:hypothetical protein
MAYMKKSNPFIIVAAFIASGLVVCLTVAAVFSYLARRPGLTAFDDSDLIPTRMEIPVVSNAFWTLVKATNELYWPAPLSRKLDDLSDNTNWDDSLAADVLTKNHASLDLFDAAMQQPYLLVPEPKTSGEDYLYLGDWRAISRVESIRVFAFSRAKNEKDAFGAALKIIQFGHRIENSGGTLIHYLVGSSIKIRGLSHIQQIAAQTSLQEADLIGVIRELDRFRPNKEGLTNALKVEYQLDCKYINDFAAGKTSSTNSDEQTMASIGMKPLFNAAKTQRKLAEAYRVFRDNISKPLGQMDWSDLPLAETNASVWKRLIKGNAMGDMIFDLLEPSLKGFCAKRCREDVEVTATQLLLALRIYKEQHGKLPDSLSELVPEFFPQVPIDDFDGKPFRYRPDKKLIYSVGPDLKDSGGEDFRKNSGSDDLPFKIDF